MEIKEVEMKTRRDDNRNQILQPCAPVYNNVPNNDQNSLMIASATLKTDLLHLPFDSSTSAVTLIVKGKSLGMTGLKAFSARAPLKTHTYKHLQHNHIVYQILYRNDWLAEDVDLNTHTMSELSPVEAGDLSNLICCIWRKLKVKGKILTFSRKPKDTNSHESGERKRILLTSQ